MSRFWNMILGWEKVLETSSIDEYMKMKNELEIKGVQTQSEFINNPSSHRGLGSLNNVGTYYLYVKKIKNK
ncbi:MAG: hypothetical protein PHY47_03580 [Lachnospiraceae bacterium]|nr:hypothetical protein [Lachnospiraceae bacterium]